MVEKTYHLAPYLGPYVPIYQNDHWNVAITLSYLQYDFFLNVLVKNNPPKKRKISPPQKKFTNVFVTFFYLLNEEKTKMIHDWLPTCQWLFCFLQIWYNFARSFLVIFQDLKSVIFGLRSGILAFFSKSDNLKTTSYPNHLSFRSLSFSKLS